MYDNDSIDDSDGIFEKFGLSGNLTPDEHAKALRLYREGLRRQEAKERGHVSLGRNQHHGIFQRICRDQILYRAGLVKAAQCHRDAELDNIPNMQRMARDHLALAGVNVSGDIRPLELMGRALSTE